MVLLVRLASPPTPALGTYGLIARVVIFFPSILLSAPTGRPSLYKSKCSLKLPPHRDDKLYGYKGDGPNNT
jgi:hypothetical protein